jgi:cyclase
MTSRVRFIARLDIKGPNLIKGIHLEGLRVIGDPREFARGYYEQGVDEIVYMDIVASLYGRNSLHDIVRRTAHDVFVPLTVGGGVRSVEDVRELLRAGADKIAINTAAVKNPELIREIAHVFGSQCLVLSIEAKRQAKDAWEAYTDNGREKTGLDVIEWARRAVGLGAGEIMVTSVDQEGTRKGFDTGLVRAISDAVNIPVIASGGMGSVDHLVEVVKEGHADAVAVAGLLHYRKATIPEIRSAAIAAGVAMRHVA